jgi:hypothetical protein
MRKLTVPADEGRRTAVQTVVETHEGVTVLEPTRSLSAPVIGRKPFPVIVTVVEAVVTETSGLTFLMEVEVSRVAYCQHMRAARPG